MFSNVSFGIDQGQKVAIVAKNGSGKTTLLNCLMEREQYDEGKIVFRKDIKVAFMEQSENLPADQTIDEVIYDHESPKLRLIKAYNEALEKGDENKLEFVSGANRYGCLGLEARVNQLLSVLS